MKTIKQWLDTLEEPYRTQAINNTDREDYEETAKDLGNALGKAFFWKGTPEGFVYWCDLFDKTNENKTL